MLAKARKRPMLLLPYYKLVAFFSRPVLKLTLPSLSLPSSNQNTDTDIDTNQRPSFLTVGDTLFIAVAFFLGSTGFSIGYFVGKLTANSVRNVEGFPIALADSGLWTVCLAIGFDTIYVNFI